MLAIHLLEGTGVHMEVTAKEHIVSTTHSIRRKGVKSQIHHSSNQVSEKTAHTLSRETSHMVSVL